MQRRSISAMGAGTPKTVPNPGSVSAVGPAGAAPKPRLKNTRDYGKKSDEPSGEAPGSVSPFGPTQRPGGLF